MTRCHGSCYNSTFSHPISAARLEKAPPPSPVPSPVGSYHVLFEEARAKTFPLRGTNVHVTEKNKRDWTIPFDRGGRESGLRKEGWYAQSDSGNAPSWAVVGDVVIYRV